MTHEELYKKNGDEQFYTSVIGSLGAVRHAGIFTENNPYVAQFNSATTNEDRDALYAQAVEWQANYYNTLESREYNDPMADIQRKRKAGYNPDLAGASGVSRSAGASGAPVGSSVTSPQSGVSYSSAYGNVSAISQGVTSACDLVSTIASFGTASIDAVEKIRTMPSRVSLAESQAYIADQTKDNIVESHKYSNVQQRLSLVNQLSSFFTPDSSSDDYVNILGTLGFGETEIPNLENAIREYHTNPAYKASYENSIKEFNDNSAYNAVYTPQVQNDLYEGTLFVQRSDLNLSKLNSQIETSLNSYLVSHGYGEQVASNIVSSAELESKDISFSRTKLERDIAVFSDQLEIISSEINRSRGRINEIRDNAQKLGRTISPSEQLEIDTLSNLISQMLTLGSSNLDTFFGLVDNANAIVYQNAELIGDDGKPVLDVVTPRFVRTLDITFGNYVKGEGVDLTSLLTSLIPSVGIRSSTSRRIVKRVGLSSVKP